MSRRCWPWPRMARRWCRCWAGTAGRTGWRDGWPRFWDARRRSRRRAKRRSGWRWMSRRTGGCWRTPRRRRGWRSGCSRAGRRGSRLTRISTRHGWGGRCPRPPPAPLLRATWRAEAPRDGLLYHPRVLASGRLRAWGRAGGRSGPRPRRPGRGRRQPSRRRLRLSVDLKAPSLSPCTWPQALTSRRGSSRPSGSSQTPRLTARSEAAFRATGCWGVAEGAALAAAGAEGGLLAKSASVSVAPPRSPWHLPSSTRPPSADRVVGSRSWAWAGMPRGARGRRSGSWTKSRIWSATTSTSTSRARCPAKCGTASRSGRSRSAAGSRWISRPRGGAWR